MALQGKVVVITGGAMGIGRYVARTFAAEGAKLAIADIAPMDTVANEVKELGADVLTVKTDVTNEDDVRSLMEEVYRRYGRLDVLLNDAAIVHHFHYGGPRWPRIRSMDLSFFKKVIDVNLIGTFLATKHALPYMESLKAGHVVNFGQELVGRRARPPEIGANVYNVSKIAIRAFTLGVALEEREFNICVVSMGPGSGSVGPRKPWNLEEGLVIEPGSLGGIVTEEAPEWARATAKRTVESLGNRYVLAAEAPMELSGHQLEVENGQLVIAPD